MVGLPGQSLLKNQYWFLRHGTSIPNESGLIVSSLSNGLSSGYGLAPTGIVQANLAGELLLKDFQCTGILSGHIKIYASPFSRTRQTAEAVAVVFRQQKINPTIELVEDLKERFFGPALELQSHDHYPEIWRMDARDPMVGPEGGESVSDVAKRVIRVVQKIENEAKGYSVLIVSHGDTLQILQAIIAQALGRAVIDKDDNLMTRLQDSISPFTLQQHRKFAMVTGELRRLA